ncbi:MAG: WYL domain-containing protein [Faecalimonas sp.]|nr:WYL domain-containing protein [Faecalimonas sp.]
MAKSENQKLKLLYLMKILLEKTDEQHGLSMKQILDELKAYDIAAERKSIYSDIECLRLYGLDIIGEQIDGGFVYYIASRDFELAELKLLVDAIQSAKFIPAKKSTELIKKIEAFASKYEASQLQRQVFVSGRIKTMNESIYYNVDAIHSAIAANKQIRFQYFQWNVKKEMELRKGGAYYQVSPWALSWDDENYYLVAYDSAEEKIKHYRVDKMLNISQSDEAREGQKCFARFDTAIYAKKMFSMYAGEEETVKLICKNELAGAIIDRFGKDVLMRKIDEEQFAANVRVAVSQQFIHWVMALGAGAKIVGPEHVVDMVKEEVRRLEEQYRE